MSPATKATLVKFGKYVGAGAIAAGVTLLVSPDVLSWIPTQFTFLVPAVVIPVLAEIDKKFFGQSPVVPVPAPAPVTPPTPDPVNPDTNTV